MIPAEVACLCFRITVDNVGLLRLEFPWFDYNKILFPYPHALAHAPGYPRIPGVSVLAHYGEPGCTLHLLNDTEHLPLLLVWEYNSPYRFLVLFAAFEILDTVVNVVFAHIPPFFQCPSGLWQCIKGTAMAIEHMGC
ncbi:hypothetical membrane protein [Thermoplasma acidophilum]|uniref:Hypothetical membrane protein n=1 Tax=Thermoplasma acidophilum (strain ATCC 25905 / DSM 1728 / JCM 9062 / NBRC 15155 / AMRC-C165) TaxID=273075 RepID=Q9HL42_THEAC|nr:hypothetical membrane protein [Thermoplasma acidophilum]